MKDQVRLLSAQRKPTLVMPGAWPLSLSFKWSPTGGPTSTVTDSSHRESSAAQHDPAWARHGPAFGPGRAQGVGGGVGFRVRVSLAIAT